MLSQKTEWEERYKNKDTPWDSRSAEPYLIGLVQKGIIKSGTALDIGCGTGNESIFLAQQGFKVTGIDLSETAVREAKEKALASKVNPTFIQMDFLTNSLEGTFDFILDRRVFHFFDPSEHSAYIHNIEKLLAPKGFFLLIVSSEHEKGENRHHYSKDDVINIFSPFFALKNIELITLHTHKEKPISWAALWQSNKNIWHHKG